MPGAKVLCGRRRSGRNQLLVSAVLLRACRPSRREVIMIVFGMVVVERRNRAQPGDDGRQMLEQIIDFIAGVVNAQAESDTTPRASRAEAHGDQNVRRVERAGGASRPARNA